jgi:UDP-glucose 4-epimerase
MTRVLITGVAGHLGSRLAEWILREQPGTTVVGIDDLSCGYLENVPPYVAFVRGDCTHPVTWEQYDYVFHFAAYAAECMSPFVRQFNYTNNLVQTSALVSSLINSEFAGRLVFASSIAVYGDGRSPFDESHHCNPHDPYGVAKHACEQDILIAGNQHGLDWCIVRPHNIYGPYQSIWQRYRNVLGLWMRAVLEDQPITIFGDGGQQRAFTFIDDILPCLWRAATSDHAAERVINLGGSKLTSINELYDAFAAATGIFPKIDQQPARHEVRKAYCTTRRSEELLGYRDVVGLEQGIAEMWAWAKTAWALYPERRMQEPELPIETTVGMPESWKKRLVGLTAVGR